MLKADYYICPECGAEVRVGSKGCIRCASDRATKHWDQDEFHHRLGLFEDDFSYEEFIDNEFRGGSKKPASKRFWWWLGLVLLIGWAVIAFRLYAWPSWMW